MSVPDRLLGLLGPGPSHREIERVARDLRGTELAITKHQVQRWADGQILSIDLAARARATERALNLDFQVYDRGMALADGNGVKQELLLRYLQDQNDGFRRLINRVLD